MRLAAQNPRRRDLVGIIDWRLSELSRLGVDIRYNIWAESGDVLALEPDVVIVATGGLPQNPPLAAGDDLVTSSWDIIAGRGQAGRKRAALRRQWRPSGHDSGGTHRQRRLNAWNWFRRSGSLRRRWVA